MRILKKEFSLARSAHFLRSPMQKLMGFGVPPEPVMPAADVPPRSRLRGVFIFEQNGALAPTPSAFRFQAALEPTAMNCNDTVHTPFKRFSVLECVTWPVY